MKNNLPARLLGAIILLQILLFTATTALAQVPDTNVPEMADALRTSGKIYVVVLVIVIILSGLFLYLVRLDRKVSRLEREVAGR